MARSGQRIGQEAATLCLWACGICWKYRMEGPPPNTRVGENLFQPEVAFLSFSVASKNLRSPHRVS